MKKPVPKPQPPFKSVQFREESYGPFTGRTQNFMRYTVSPTATDARIKRSR